MSQVAVRLNESTCSPRTGGQTDFLSDWQRFYIGLEGGWGAGKSWCGARKLLVAHIANAFDDDGRPTFVPQACVGPTYRSLMDYDLPALREAASDMNVSCTYKSTDSVLIFPDFGTQADKSLIYLRSAEKPDRIAGWQVGYGWGDEPTRWPESWDDPRNDSFLQFDGRVRHPKARVRGMALTYTNEGDATRMYEWFRSGSRDCALYRARTADNPSVQEFYDRQVANMTKEMQEQYLEGGAMSLRGAKCYSSFVDENVNVAAGFIPGVPVAICLDFNIRPGMHALLGQYIPQIDVFTVFEEFYRDRLNIRDLCPMVCRALIRRGVRHVNVYGDSSGNAGSANTGDSGYDTLFQGLRKHKVTWEMHVKKDHPAVIDRVNAVNLALSDMEGAKHVLINPECKRLIKDLRKVKFDDKGKIDKKNVELTHASDAFGYWVEYIRPVRIPSEDDGTSRFSVRASR